MVAGLLWRDSSSRLCDGVCRAPSRHVYVHVVKNSVLFIKPCNEAVRGDMGLETLQGQRDRAKLKWWYKLVSMAEDRYLKQWSALVKCVTLTQLWLPSKCIRAPDSLRALNSFGPTATIVANNTQSALGSNTASRLTSQEHHALLTPTLVSVSSQHILLQWQRINRLRTLPFSGSDSGKKLDFLL